jgi:micrococcal nuclease
MAYSKKNITYIGIGVFFLASMYVRYFPQTSQSFFVQKKTHSVPTQLQIANSRVVDGDVLDMYRVERVVDGDTIVVAHDGVLEKVRLLGINTPETVDPRKKVECFGKQASEKTKELVLGKEVTIEFDQTQGMRDKYDRLLAYVTTSDGIFVNNYLVASGYAYEYTYNIPYIHQAEFKKAQHDAQALGLGLWAPGVCE